MPNSCVYVSSLTWDRGNVVLAKVHVGKFDINKLNGFNPSSPPPFSPFCDVSCRPQRQSLHTGSVLNSERFIQLELQRAKRRTLLGNPGSR